MSASSNKSEGSDLPDIRKRLAYSLLKAAVSFAAKSELTMGELTELLQLAYFEELRTQYPKELSSIAERLGLSLRSITSLNKKLKKTFFSAEMHVQPVRRVTAELAGRPQSSAELQQNLPDLSRQSLKEAIKFLEKNEWLTREKRKLALSTRLRSYVNSDLARRIDGLNHQMTIISKSVWQRFMEEGSTGMGRSWAFQALPENVEQFLLETIKTLRHSAVDLEEEALVGNGGRRYGITLAFAPTEDHDD